MAEEVKKEKQNWNIMLSGREEKDMVNIRGIRKSIKPGVPRFNRYKCPERNRKKLRGGHGEINNKRKWT